MKGLVILWKPLIGVISCAGIAGIAGCSGMAKKITHAHHSSRIESQIRIDETCESTPHESTNSQPAELTLASHEDNDGSRTAQLDGVDEVLLPPPALPKESEFSETTSDQATRVLSQLAPSVRDVEGTTITLDELQQMAAALNPTLQQAQAMLEQARGNWLQVGLYPNPTVEAQRGANNAPFDMFNVFVSQEIVTAKKLQLNRAVASCDIERARWEVETQKLRVFNDVQIRYVAALGAQYQVAVAEQLVKISQDGVHASEQRLAGEQASEVDVLQARLQLSQTQIVLRKARFQASATWKQLANVIGNPDLPPGPLAGDLEEEVPELQWENAWQQLLSDNPLLRVARARVAAAQAQVCREEQQPRPNLHLTGGYGREFLAPQYPMYTFRVAITPPAFNRNQGNIAAAFAELHAAQSDIGRIELSLRNGLTRTFQRYLSARNQIQTYQTSFLPLAEKNLSLTLKRYEEGEIDFLRVLTARRDLFDARIEYVKALTDLRTSAIEVQGLMLTGGLDAVDSKPTPSNRAGQTVGPGN